MQKKGYHIFSVGNFLSHSAEKNRRGTHRCFKKFRVSKNLCIRGGYEDFPLKIFLCHSAEKISRGTLRCLTKFRVSKHFMHKSGHHDVMSIIFCLTVKKYFLGEPFCVPEKFRVSKNFMYKRVSRFSVVIIKFKNVGKGLGLEPVPTASEPCCFTHCAIGTMGTSNKCQ